MTTLDYQMHHLSDNYSTSPDSHKYQLYIRLLRLHYKIFPHTPLFCCVIRIIMYYLPYRNIWDMQADVLLKAAEHVRPHFWPSQMNSHKNTNIRHMVSPIVHIQIHYISIADHPDLYSHFHNHIGSWQNQYHPLSRVPS